MFLAGTTAFSQPVSIRWLAYHEEGATAFPRNAYYPALELGPYGNIYVVGGNNSSFIVTRYSATGETVWDRADDVSGLATFVGIDSAGYSYVVGVGPTNQGESVVTVSYDANGNLRWFRNIGSKCWVKSAHVDLSGNVVIVADTQLSLFDQGALVVKYNSDGFLIWINRLDGWASCFDVDVDSVGNVYVGGVGQFNEQHETGAIVYKYSPGGALLWRYGHNGTGWQMDVGRSLAVDRRGFVYLVGETYDEASNYSNCLIAKITQSGDVVWTRTFDGPNGLDDKFLNVSSDHNGNVVVAGDSRSIGSFLDMITAKYDSAGNLLWMKGYDSYEDDNRGLAIDALDNVYVTGTVTTYNATEETRDIVTIKYSSSGEELWIQTYDSPLHGNEYSAKRAIRVDSCGTVFVTINSSGPGLEGYTTIAYQQDLNGDSSPEFCCCFGTTGNVDCDGYDVADVSDLATLISHLYGQGSPLCCGWEANTDGLTGIDISDISALIHYLYIDFTHPAACQ